MKNPSENATYIGDGVYAEVENEQIKLSTQRGYDEWDVIYLDRSVFMSLTRFFQTNQEQIP
jgi:hypothetical protein